MITLPKAQKELLEKAKEKGFLELTDFVMAYASPVTRKAAIERFVALGLIIPTNTPNKYKYTGKEI